MKADLLKQSVRDGRSVVEYQIQAGEMMDGFVLKQCKEGKVLGVLPMGAVYENGHNYMYAYTDKKETLEERLQDTATQELLLRSFESIVNTLVRMDEQGINLAYMVMDVRYIYMDDEIKKARLICMPGKNAVSEADKYPDFFRTILANAVYLNSEDGDYVAKMLSAINKDFELKSFLRLIHGLMTDAGIDIIEEKIQEPKPVAVEEAPEAEPVAEEAPEEEPVAEEPVAEEAPEEKPVAEEPVAEEAPEEEPVAEESIAEEVPAAAESITSELPIVEPAAAEPVAEKMQEEEPVKPVAVEMPVAEPIAAEPIIPEVPAVEPIAAEPIIPEMPAAEPIAAEPIIPEVPAVEPVAAEPIIPEVPAVEPIAAEPIIPEMPAVEPVAAEPIIPEMPAVEPVAAEPIIPEVPVAEPIPVNPITSVIQEEEIEFEPMPEEMNAKIERMNAQTRQTPPMPNVQAEPAPQQAAYQSAEQPYPAPMPGTIPQPGMVPQQPGMAPQQPGMVSQQPGMAPQQPGMVPQQPGMAPQQPGMVPGMAPQPQIMPQDATYQQRTPNPHLIRVKTGESISLPEGSFVIGKSQMGVDYVITDNTAISRIHCTIIKKNGVYYVRDEKSTNSTFVNGEQVLPETEKLLLNNCKLRLGDEEFIYTLW